MFIVLLGRQPQLGAAELERLYGAKRLRWFSTHSMLVDTDHLTVDSLGGSVKAGRVVWRGAGDWQRASRWIVAQYSRRWRHATAKLTLGVSAYGTTAQARDVQKTGLLLKKILRQQSVSLRLVPNQTAALNTATSHHNQLGRSARKVELLIVQAPSGQLVIAESTGAQNITAYARRDQQRPRRDAFVGMLPPKLAQLMVNLATPATARPNLVTANSPHRHSILDPFCGTGTVLQEALIKGNNVYGSDLQALMVTYSRDNLTWLQQQLTLPGRVMDLTQADATTHQWPYAATLTAVVCETYLGQPFSAPPTPAKLRQVVGTCDHIIRQFLTNLRPQITDSTCLVLAVPAWRDATGHLTQLPLLTALDDLGYQQVRLRLVRSEQLLYYRPTQVVARRLLIIHPKTPLTTTDHRAG